MRGVRGDVADGQPYGPVTEVGDQVKAPAQGFDVARDDLERCHPTMLDLGYLGDAHAHRCSDISLREAELLACLCALEMML